MLQHENPQKGVYRNKKIYSVLIKKLSASSGALFLLAANQRRSQQLQRAVESSLKSAEKTFHELQTAIS